VLRTVEVVHPDTSNTNKTQTSEIRFMAGKVAPAFASYGCEITRIVVVLVSCLVHGGIDLGLEALAAKRHQPNLWLPNTA